jgi:L-asparaginase
MNIIHFIQAGGTIDKDYLTDDDNRAYNFVIGDPAYRCITDRAEIPYPVGFTMACQKDSSDMDDQDRDTIRRIASEVAEDKIIIPHGTDTLHVTAEHLADISGKVIVLTGALKPERLRDSDADFNLGMAVGAIQCLPAGVYIALCGELKRWDEYIPRSSPILPE